MLAPGNHQHTGMVNEGACNQKQTLDMAYRISAVRLTFGNMQVGTGKNFTTRRQQVWLSILQKQSRYTTPYTYWGTNKKMRWCCGGMWLIKKTDDLHRCWETCWRRLVDRCDTTGFVKYEEDEGRRKMVQATLWQHTVLISIRAVKASLSNTLNPFLLLGFSFSLIPLVSTCKSCVFDSEALKPPAPNSLYIIVD